VIKYRLRCARAHEFEAWFASSQSYESQEVARKVCCPKCGSRDVAKAIMAPNVAARAHCWDDGDASDDASEVMDVPQVGEVLREVRRSLLSASEDVGARFPEEARKIHYGETEPRGIRGMASSDEVQTLLDEGITVLALPPLPEDAN
jgi:hypothetical protein